MSMNRMHRRICGSESWADAVASGLPKWLAHYDLGEDVLEIGPGFGATTAVLADRLPRLTVLEIDPDYARGLEAAFGDRVKVVTGSGAEMPFGDASFSGVVCFTMLHHVPTAALQDGIFREACRVLRPGGVFCGYDSQPNLRFRVLHIGDTMNPVTAAGLPDRLAGAGFQQVDVRLDPKRRVSFSAVKP